MMKTIVESNVSAIFYELAEKFADYRTIQEYGTNAFWNWYSQVSNYIKNLHSHNLRYGINKNHKIPRWGILNYSKFSINGETLVIVHSFEYSQRNLWLWLNHKTNRRPSYSICDTCFGYSVVLYDNSQKYGILKPDGKPLLKPIFDDIINFHHSTKDYNVIHAIGFIGDRVYEINQDGTIQVLHMSRTDYLDQKHRYDECKKRFMHYLIENKQNKTYRTMNRVRLTESQLHNVIRRCINEAYADDYDMKANAWNNIAGGVISYVDMRNLLMDLSDAGFRSASSLLYEIEDRIEN